MTFMHSVPHPKHFWKRRIRIRDIDVLDVVAGKNWYLLEETTVRPTMLDWEVTERGTFSARDTVVYSALSVYVDGEVRAALMAKEVGTPEWWGDTCEYFQGKWHDVDQRDGAPVDETFVASPLDEDPSFMGEYSHAIQKRQFLLFKDRIPPATSVG